MINKYIGVPYLFNGRTMQGLDCWGLVELAMAELRGVQLPVWSAVSDNPKDVDQAIRQAKKHPVVTLVAAQQDYDIVVFKRRLIAYHVGLYFKGKVVHASRQANQVIMEPLSAMQATCRGNVEYYRCK